MNNRKLIIFAVILIIIIVVLFCVILNVLGGGQKPSSGKNGYVDKEFQKQVQKVNEGQISGKYDAKKKNEDYYKLVQEDRDLIDRLIEHITNLINNKKSSELYNMFNVSYKNAMYPNVEDFETFLNELLAEDNKVNAKEFSVNGSSLIIPFTYVGDGKTIFNVKVNNYENYEDETNSMEIYFSDILMVDRARILYNNTEFLIRSDYCFVYEDEFSLITEITNKTNKELKLDFADTVLHETFGVQEADYSMVTTRYVTVPAKSTIKYEMGFVKPRFDPEGIKLKINTNDKNYDLYIYVTMGSLDDDDSL